MPASNKEAAGLTLLIIRSLARCAVPRARHINDPDSQATRQQISSTDVTVPPAFGIIYKNEPFSFFLPPCAASPPLSPDFEFIILQAEEKEEKEGRYGPRYRVMIRNVEDANSE